MRYSGHCAHFGRIPKWTADGSLICAFAITEPEAGSDVGAMTTFAERRGDGYAISGEKTFISNAGLAHRYVLFARTSDDLAHARYGAYLRQMSSFADACRRVRLNRR